VIDDDQPVRATIQLVLEIEVVAVESGRAGKKAIEATSFDAAIAAPALPEPANHRGIRSDHPVRLS
jgi:hypothetical protein